MADSKEKKLKGLAHLSDGELKTAALDRNNSDAQWLFGYRCYQVGKERWAEAREFLTYAADAGHSAAQHIVAKMYARGWGGHRNMHLALSYFRQAAKNHVASAQFQLGLYYSKGVEIEGETVLERDIAVAIRYLDMAHKNRYQSKRNRKVIEEELSNLKDLLKAESPLDMPLRSHEQRALRKRFGPQP